MILKRSPRVVYGVLILAMVVVGLCNISTVEGVNALFVFGDSYMDTGNSYYQLDAPYGTTWPGFPTNRWSDGRNQADYFAELFGLPTPTPFRQVYNKSQVQNGVNFAWSSAGVTYAFGVPPLDVQVDNMESLIDQGILPKPLLRHSVAVINIGVNDYDARNLLTPFQESWLTSELTTFVTTVVDGIAMAIARLDALGVRHIVVTNLADMACIPLSTQELEYSSCSSNSTIVNQTMLHNSLLQKRVHDLNNHLPALHVIIADLTKAFQHLFSNGSSFGFVDPLVPCCHGNGTDVYALVCGKNNTEGKPLYTQCLDASKAVLFDTIHPTQAAWKAIVNLYAEVEGFTSEGPKLSTWMQKYNL